MFTVVISGLYVCVFSHSVVSDSATLWTIARQAPLSMGFFRQEYWTGLPFPPPGESSRPRDQTCISYVFCIAGGALQWVIYKGVIYEGLFF